MTLGPKDTSRAVFLSALEVLARQGVQFVIGVALARLIAPTEFGLVAALLFFTSIAGLFVESGFGTALIQQREISHADESTVFWFNLVSATVMALLLAFAAPWIAAFFEQPRLIPLAWVMALNMWVQAWSSVHVALLAKKLDFEIQMKASLSASLLAGVFAIFLAYSGAGVWALVMQILVATLVNVVMIWLQHPWRPIFHFCWSSFSRMFRFGRFLLLSSLLDVIATRFYMVLIGKAYSVHDLGIYGRAVAMRDFPQNILGSVFSRVAFPVFSSHSHDLVLLRRSLKDAISIMMVINLPLMLGLCVTADVFVSALFGSQWAASVPILRILCGVGLLWPMQAANLNALMAQGYSNLFFRLEMVKKFLLVSLVAVASQWGLIAIAWATFISSLLSFFVNAHYTKKYLRYSALEQLRDIRTCAFVAIVIAGGLFLLGIHMSELPSALQLALHAGVGLSIYVIVGHGLGLKAFQNIKRAMVSVVFGGTMTSHNQEQK